MIVHDKTRLTGGLPPEIIKNNHRDGGYFIPQHRCQASNKKWDYLTLLTMALKAFGSLTASSDRTLRSNSILAAFKPAIS